MLKTKNDNPIAFFDSGVGGLTVFEKVLKLLPEEEYIYLGDTKNMPYGEKTPEELIKITRRVLDFFAKSQVKAVVMGCNTTSAVAFDAVKAEYPFKIYPVIQSVAEIFGKLKIKRLGVFATAATINSGAYEREIKKFNSDAEVFSKSCQGWVEIVESGTQNEPESKAIVKKYLDELLDKGVEKIILGCTHYPYLLNILEEFAPREMFLDPSEYFAQYIVWDIERRSAARGAAPQIFTTANPEGFAKAAEMFYTLSDLPKLVNLE